MNDPEPPHNVEQPAPFYGPMEQDPPPVVPSFVCLLPCTNQTVTYADRLDGCSTGIHATLEDINNLQVFYGRMADAIEVNEEPPEATDTDDRCPVCLAPTMPSPTSPGIYLENCFHGFHYDCYARWRRETGALAYLIDRNCSYCRVASCRAVLWPQVFRTAAEKNELFRLQKRSFGLHVSPQTVVQASGNERSIGLLFDNKKSFCLRKRPVAPEPTIQQLVQQGNQRAAEQGPVRISPQKEVHLVDVIQRLHLADQPRAFYLGDILPLQENAQYEAIYGPVRLLQYEHQRLRKLLLQFLCPLERLANGRCRPDKRCEYFHHWPENTPAFITERVKLRHFPSFFCQMHVLSYRMFCDERIRMHSNELVRCQNGFHVSAQDLADMDGFARKMATQIMSPVTVPEPEQHLVCAFCRQADQPNSVWMHFQNCAHCLHVRCLPLVRHNYSHLNRKLDIHCPACQVPSVRTMAWPGPFRSQTVKKDIFKRQLMEFNLQLQSDTQLAIQEANQANIFTIDFGQRNVITVDRSTEERHSTIWMD